MQVKKSAVAIAVGIVLLLFGVAHPRSYWRMVDVGVGLAQINGVAMSPSGQHIVLSSDFNLHSSDRGVTWEQFDHSGPAIMDFGDETHLFGVGSNPGSGFNAVYRSTDYGKTWFSLELPLNFIYFSEVDFVDSVHGWAVGDKDFAVTTNTGWKSWIARSYGISGYTGGGVSFIDPLHGWVGGGVQGTDTSVLATTDGGNSWTPCPSIPFGAGRIDFVDSLNGWSQGGGKGIFHSTDGGKTWTEQGTFGYFGGAIIGPQAVDSLHTWVCGHYFGPFIWKTTDGGRNWTLEYNEAGSSLRDAVMVDTERGVAVGAYGTVLIYAPLILGDLNGDEEITVVDVVLELNKVFLELAFPAPAEAGDTNCDGSFTPADVVLLLNRTFLFTPFPCSL